MSIHSQAIDLVYLWVDGDDPEWRAKKIKYTGGFNNTSEATSVGRYISNDELKYALRSAAMYVPWIRRIHIVTDNQQPEWLNAAHPQIHLVDHRDILPAKAIPTFNSNVIEYSLYRIGGLSEHFLYANDDMFFNTPLSPLDFFTKEGIPIVRLKRKPLGKWHYKLKQLVGKKLGHYAQALYDASLLVEEKFGKYYSGIPHHNVDSYRKSDYRTAVEDVFREQISSSEGNRLREYGDLQRLAFSYYALATGHAQLQYVNRKESSRILVNRHHFENHLQRYQPKLFCLNDNQRATDKDRMKIKPFLEQTFPNKSPFEK